MTPPSKPLAWDDFRLVKALADGGSMASAAASLGINHSTVFRRLGQIEKALGAPFLAQFYEWILERGGSVSLEDLRQPAAA